MKRTYLFFIAVLVFNMNYCEAQNSSAFDHFWFVQVWPQSYCMQIKCYRNSPIFILHGLWPVSYDDQTLEGTNKSEPGLLDSLLENDLGGDLMEHWLSLGTKHPDRLQLFWIYQWEKHGSAQKLLKPLDYFRRAIELTKNTDLLNTLAEKGILANGESYPKVKYKKAIQAKTGYTPRLTCVNKNGHDHLKEVYICVDARARNFRACNVRKRDGCGAKNIKFPTTVM